MDNLFWYIARSSRPRQWLKNFSLFAALIFSGNLFVASKFLTTLFAVLIFSLLTSSVYFLNDIADAPSDKLHPYKRFRPIAKGDLPIPLAFFLAMLGIFLSFYLGLNISFFFFLILLTYLLLQLAYTFSLKNIVILDVLIIAAGFILRIYAGAVAISAHLSVWFLLCVISLALFLAVGKRRAELTILSESSSPKTRKTLSLYSPALLDDYLSIFASSTWLAWALFAFFEPPPPIKPFPFLIHLPLTFSAIGKWLMLTIPIVIYGIMRYLKIVYEGSKAESPERVLLSDRPLLIAALLWGIMIITVIYGVNF